ncbi:hypothetical protein YC2023_048924 [Brassica napus]
MEAINGKYIHIVYHYASIEVISNHRTFIISTVTEDTIIENHGKEHSENILPSGEGDVGLAASFGPTRSMRNVLQQILRKTLRTTASAAVMIENKYSYQPSTVCFGHWFHTNIEEPSLYIMFNNLTKTAKRVTS